MDAGSSSHVCDQQQLPTSPAGPSWSPRRSSSSTWQQRRSIVKFHEHRRSQTTSAQRSILKHSSSQSNTGAASPQHRRTLHNVSFEYIANNLDESAAGAAPCLAHFGSDSSLDLSCEESSSSYDDGFTRDPSPQPKTIPSSSTPPYGLDALTFKLPPPMVTTAGQLPEIRDGYKTPITNSMTTSCSSPQFGGLTQYTDRYFLQLTASSSDSCSSEDRVLCAQSYSGGGGGGGGGGGPSLRLDQEESVRSYNSNSTDESTVYVPEASQTASDLYRDVPRLVRDQTMLTTYAKQHCLGSVERKASIGTLSQVGNSSNYKVGGSVSEGWLSNVSSGSIDNPTTSTVSGHIEPLVLPKHNRPRWKSLDEPKSEATASYYGSKAYTKHSSAASPSTTNCCTSATAATTAAADHRPVTTLSHNKSTWYASTQERRCGGGGGGVMGPLRTPRDYELSLATMLQTSRVAPPPLLYQRRGGPKY